MLNLEVSLVIDRSLQPRQNLQILRLVGILPLRRNLHILILPLLLCLPYLNPLLRGEMLPQLRKGISRESQSLENRTIGNGIKDDMIVRPTTNEHDPRQKKED